MIIGEKTHSEYRILKHNIDDEIFCTLYKNGVFLHHRCWNEYEREIIKAFLEEENV